MQDARYSEEEINPSQKKDSEAKQDDDVSPELPEPYYDKHATYLSLRSALRKGSTGKQKIVVIKECCEKNSGKKRVAVVHQDTESIPRSKGDLLPVVGGKETIAINEAGQFTLEGYDFFSYHPNWKVRIAVAAGLSRIKTEQSLAILTQLLEDPHPKVQLAAIQTIETFDKKNALAALARRDKDSSIAEPVIRARQRIMFESVETVLPKRLGRKLYARNVLRKVFDKKAGRLKLLMSHRLFALVRRWWGQPVIKQVPITARMKASSSHFDLPRRTKKKTKQRKDNLLAHLLFAENPMIVNRVNKAMHPVPGEIYWAISTSKTDPKSTRPMLIVEIEKKIPSKETPLKTLVMLPLTTKINTREDGVLVTIEGEQSKIQTSRARRRPLNTALLTTKIMTLDKKTLGAVKKAVEEAEKKAEEAELAQQSSQPKPTYQHHLSSGFFSRRRRRHLPYDDGVIDQLGATTTAEQVKLISCR